MYHMCSKTQWKSLKYHHLLNLKIHKFRQMEGFYTMFLIIKITTMIGLWTRISVLPAIYKRDFETMIDTRFFLAYISFGRTPPPLPCLTTTLPRG